MKAIGILRGNKNHSSNYRDIFPIDELDYNHLKETEGMYRLGNKLTKDLGITSLVHIDPVKKEIRYGNGHGVDELGFKPGRPYKLSELTFY